MRSNFASSPLSPPFLFFPHFALYISLFCVCVCARVCVQGICYGNIQKQDPQEDPGEENVPMLQSIHSETELAPDSVYLPAGHGMSDDEPS